METQYRIVRVQNCFLYEHPGTQKGQNDAEVTDEILSGWAVQVLEETAPGWEKIRTHYGYEGYVRSTDLKEISQDELALRQHRPESRRITRRITDVLSRPKVQGNLLETLYKDSFVTWLEDVPEGWSRIRTAAGTEGYVHTRFLGARTDDDGALLGTETLLEKKARVLAATDEETLREHIVESAMDYLGTQYRWAGKSPAGIDCSGLAFMSYLENGLLLYRDAKIVEGFPITEITKDQLKKGDLLFFPGHVAVYLGDDKYIHSTGYEGTPYVTINSLNLHDPAYRDDLAHKLTACGSVFAQNAETAAETNAAEAPISDAAAFTWLQQKLDQIPGKISFVYRDLLTGASYNYKETEAQPAASVIKLYLMTAIFQDVEEGRCKLTDKIPVKREDCVPSCGVLTYLDDGKEVSLRDLMELMVIVSDNTACNVLLDYYGEERMQTFLRDKMGLTKTVFHRKMFDYAKAAQGLENYTTPEDTANLLEKIWKGELVSKEASKEMLKILEDQRLNNKIPFYLHAVRPKPVIAHKTGENDGVSHDVAIIEGDRPYLMLFFGSETDAPAFEHHIGTLALEFYNRRLAGEF